MTDLTIKKTDKENTSACQDIQASDDMELHLLGELLAPVLLAYSSMVCKTIII